MTDLPPEDYDLDERIYQYERAQSKREHELEDAIEIFSKIKIVAEGDSWMNLPRIVRPPAIADQLARDSRFRVENIAKWGHTLEKILIDGQFLEQVDEKTQWYLLSAGGNDLQQGLAKGYAIHDYHPDRPTSDYLTEEGEELLQNIRTNFVTLLTSIKSKFPSLPILTHAYDYPRPLVGKGTYIGQYLRLKRIPEDSMQLIINPVIDKLNLVIASASSSVTGATYLDCRTLTEGYTWFDDMHPGKGGFATLAERFAKEMES